MKSKLTVEDIEEFEAQTLLEALGNCLELNDEFLSRYCSKEFAELIGQVPERDREYVISGVSEKHWWNGSPAENDCQDIWLDVGEIEWQFEGNPEDVFEDPNDFTIHDDLAYLYVGYGLSIEFDHKELKDNIESLK